MPFDRGTLFLGGGGAASLTPGTTAISGGTDTRVLFNDGGVVGEDAGFTYNKTTDAVTLGGATVTTSNPVLNLSQTWNAGGVTFTGLKLNVTNTASAAASLLMDLQVGGTSMGALSNDGIFGSYSYGGVAISTYNTQAQAIAQTSTQRVGRWGVTGLIVNSGAHYAWSANTGSGSDGGIGADLFLYRDAANTLAQRNGTAAQLFHVYNTWTDASNYERGEFYWASNALTLASHSAGSGTTRGMDIGTIGASAIRLFTTNAYRWTIDASGHFLAGTDNTYDIGASGATRPRAIYVASSVNSANFIITDAAGALQITSRGFLQFSADGLPQFLNNAGTGFGSLLLGPSGTTYNRLKHDATGVLAVKLADDSGYSTIRASGHHSPSATAGIGYITGAGGAVTQATDRTTAVELNTVTGKVTTTNTSLAAITIVSFTVTNSTVAATDSIILSKVSGDIDTSAWVSAVAAGSFNVSLRNNDAIAADTTAFVFNFAVIKGVIA